MQIQFIRSLVAGALFCIPCTVVQAEELDLLISKSDGTEIRYSLQEFPKLTFDPEELHVTYQGNTAHFRWTDIGSYAYVPSKQTALNPAEHREKQTLLYHENGLVLYTPTAQTITVYSLSGTVLLKKQAGHNSHNEIPYADFEQGTYILKCGDHTYKFYVK